MTRTAPDAAAPRPPSDASERRDHRMRRMLGRDPLEPHRSATPLELLFDLTFVVAFSQAGLQAAHLLELGHFGTGALAFTVAVFAIAWAWINHAWLSSAYDNDDLFFRVATLVQMVGVLVMALGMPALFASIDAGRVLDFRLVVAGYVVMRISLIALWLRAAAHDPAHRRTALSYAGLLVVAQVGWISMLLLNPPLPIAVGMWAVLVVFEFAIPMLAARRGGSTPWHAHHIAERYGLLVIVSLGEVVLGTVLAISAVVEVQGWDLETGLVAGGGTLLAFGLWWVYFTMPSAEVLARHRDRAFVWGYGHIVVFGAIAAAGAGLHVAAYVIEGKAKITDGQALLTVVVPVAVFSVALFALYAALLRRLDATHVVFFVLGLVPLAAAVAAVEWGASMGAGILIAALSPVVTIVGYETIGHRRQAEVLREVLADTPAASH